MDEPRICIVDYYTNHWMNEERIVLLFALKVI
jgi:hypothetical protein